jgi:hypothetical protein
MNKLILTATLIALATPALAAVPLPSGEQPPQYLCQDSSNPDQGAHLAIYPSTGNVHLTWIYAQGASRTLYYQVLSWHRAEGGSWPTFGQGLQLDKSNSQVLLRQHTIMGTDKVYPCAPYYP